MYSDYSWGGGGIWKKYDLSNVIKSWSLEWYSLLFLPFSSIQYMLYNR